MRDVTAGSFSITVPKKRWERSVFRKTQLSTKWEGGRVAFRNGSAREMHDFEKNPRNRSWNRFGQHRPYGVSGYHCMKLKQESIGALY